MTSYFDAGYNDILVKLGQGARAGGVVYGGPLSAEPGRHPAAEAGRHPAAEAGRHPAAEAGRPSFARPRRKPFAGPGTREFKQGLTGGLKREWASIKQNIWPNIKKGFGIHTPPSSRTIVPTHRSTPMPPIRNRGIRTDIIPSERR